MPETRKTSGGEHEVYMAEGILLLVFELRLESKNEKDHMAQVLLDLACESDILSSQRYKANKKQRHTN